MNENLEKENKILKEGGVAPGKSERQANEAQDEVRRLQAQNSALQKTLNCKYVCCTSGTFGFLIYFNLQVAAAHDQSYKVGSGWFLFDPHTSCNLVV